MWWSFHRRNLRSRRYRLLLRQGHGRHKLSSVYYILHVSVRWAKVRSCAHNSWQFLLFLLPHFSFSFAQLSPLQLFLSPPRIIVSFLPCVDILCWWLPCAWWPHRACCGKRSYQSTPNPAFSWSGRILSVWSGEGGSGTGNRRWMAFWGFRVLLKLLIALFWTFRGTFLLFVLQQLFDARRFFASLQFLVEDFFCLFRQYVFI